MNDAHKQCEDVVYAKCEVFSELVSKAAHLCLSHFAGEASLPFLQTQRLASV